MTRPREKVDAVLKILPALATPTVSTLADPDWVELSTVVEEKKVRELIPRLYVAGARGIIELALNHRAPAEQDRRVGGASAGWDRTVMRDRERSVVPVHVFPTALLRSPAPA